jgi:DNA-binding transcriptional MerR regulator
MTDEQRLTLEELAGAVGMTTRNVRAYQTRGLLQPPRRAGRSSVYGEEHLERLRQVQRARARGAPLQLLRTLIGEGRDLDGVWEARGAPPRQIDVTDAALQHTPACLAHLDVPVRPLLEELGEADDPGVRPAVLALVRRGAFTDGDGTSAPGGYGCAVEALHDQGVLGSAPAALRLTQLVAEAADAVAAVIVETTRTLDADGRRAASTRLGEFAGAVVGQVVAARVAVQDEAPSG